ncbi:MAG: lytic transglycosylase domain-containing protein [Candidatus Hydrogenedentes bacterium]|nr:lytic transglycosylase domain-containing protein [Candidatus Hydrogenedentota bacterium]
MEYRLWKKWGAAGACVVLILASARAEEPASSKKPTKPSAGTVTSVSATSARSLARVVTPAQRRAKSGIRVFRDKEGVLTVTNRPERYRNKAGFVETTVKYDPIVVPHRYRRLLAANHFSAKAVADLVGHYSKMYAVEESLVLAVIQAESDFDPYAVSRCGARGLMQLMPSTAEEMGVRDIYDPAQNIAGGTQYLARMLNLFDNDLPLALAAYNAGPETVKKYRGVPPFAETKGYIQTVCDFATQFELHGMTPNLKTGRKRPRLTTLAQDSSKFYTIHFHSGMTQLAEKITDAEPKPYFYAEFMGRTYAVRKDSVAKIETPA